MAEGQTGLAKLEPDGCVSLTVAGTRHRLRQITLDELRTLRALYNECQNNVTDFLDFDSRPALEGLRAKVADAKTRQDRDTIRAEIADAQADRDLYVQGQWAIWWRSCLAYLSPKDVDVPNPDDPAEGLEPWMVDSPAGIPRLFQHWQAVPLEGSGSTEETIALLRALGQGG